MATMALDLNQTYSLKNNAKAAIRKAVVRGEFTLGELTVAPTDNGRFRIVKTAELERDHAQAWDDAAPAAEAAPADEATAAPEAPAADDDGFAVNVLDSAPVAAAVIAAMAQDAEPAQAPDVVIDIPNVLDSADARRAAIAAIAFDAEPALGLPADPPAGEPPFPVEMPEPVADEATEVILRPAFAGDRSAVARATIADVEAMPDNPFMSYWARLNAALAKAKQAEALYGEAKDFFARALLIHKAVKELRSARAPKVVEAPTVEAEAPKAKAGRKAKAAPAAAPAVKPVKGELSAEGRAVLTALFFSPALRDTPEGRRADLWVDYKTINESDRPHGLGLRQVPGCLAGLQRRGLVETRIDKPGHYSARLTVAGLTLARGAGQ